MGDTEIEAQIYETIGELLARGYTNDKIIKAIQEVDVSRDKAFAYLRHVFDTWQSTNTSLDLDKTDFANWHIHLRMQLLRKALEDSSLPGQKLGLQILDSLAQIQGVSGAIAASAIPIQIELYPKKEKGKENDE